MRSPASRMLRSLPEKWKPVFRYETRKARSWGLSRKDPSERRPQSSRALSGGRRRGHAKRPHRARTPEQLTLAQKHAEAEHARQLLLAVDVLDDQRQPQLGEVAAHVAGWDLPVRG